MKSGEKIGRTWLLIFLFSGLFGVFMLGFSGGDRGFDKNSGQEVVLGPVAELSPPKIGEKMPDFILLDYAGNVRQFSRDFAGKPVMVNFWASWCPFCVEEMPLFQQYYSDFQASGGEIIAINRGESLELGRAFVERLGLGYVVLRDGQDALFNGFEFRMMPTTIFVDSDGVIRDIKYGALRESELVEKLALLAD